MSALPAAPRTQVVRLWVRQTLAFADRFIRELSRSWIGLFWSFGFPVMWYLLTVYLGLTPTAVGHSGSLKAILGISFGVFGAFTVTLVGFAGDLSVDISAKRYRKFRSLPLSPSADLAGRFLAGLVLGVAAALVMMLVASLDGASYVVPDLGGLLVALLALSFFCIVGMVAGLVVTIVITDPRYATTVGTGLLLSVFFVTGYNGMAPGVFPLSEWWLNYLPNSLAARLMVHHLVVLDWSAAGLSPPGIPSTRGYFLLLAGYAILLAVVGVLTVRTGIYRSNAGE